MMWKQRYIGFIFFLVCCISNTLNAQQPNDEASLAIFKHLNQLGQLSDYQGIIDTLAVWIPANKLNDTPDAVVDAILEKVYAMQALQNYEQSRVALQEGFEYYTKHETQFKEPQYAKAQLDLSLAWNHYKLFNYTECVSCAEKMIPLAISATKFPSVAGKIYNVLGLCAEKIDQHTKSIQAHQRAIEIRLNNSEIKLSNLAHSYGNIAIAYQNSGQIDSAAHYFTKRIELCFDTAIYRPFTAIKICTNVSHFYRKTGSPQQAEKYLQIADSIRKVDFPPDHFINTWVDYAFGLLYLDEYKLDQARLSLEKCLALELKIYGPQHIEAAGTYRNLCDVYSRLGDSKSFEETGQKAIELYQSKFDPYHSRIAMIYASMVYYFQKTDLTEKSDLYLNKWRTSINKRETPDDEWLDYACKQSIQYAAKGQKKGAIACLRKALKLLENNPRFTMMHNFEFLSAAIIVFNYLGDAEKADECIQDYFRLVDYKPYEIDFTNTHEDNRLLQFLNQDFAYSNRQNLHNRAFDNRLAVTAYLNLLHSTHPDQGYLAYTDHLFYRAFEDALLTAEKISKEQPDATIQEAVFMVMERGKGIKQRSHLNASTTESNHFYNQAEKKLRLAIVQAERSLSSATYIDDIQRVRDSLVVLKSRQNELNKNINTTDPDYFKLKLDLSTISLEETKNNLSSQHALLLEFLVGKEYVHLLAITENDFIYSKLSPVATIDSLAIALKDHLLKPNTQDWKSSASELYQQLLDPVMNKIDISNIDRVFISPDGLLSTVPFEVLLNGNSQMLIENKSIDYISSMTILDYKMNMYSNQQTQNMAAFAPVYKSSFASTDIGTENDYVDMLVRSGNYELKGAQSEARVIGSSMKGKVFTHSDAGATSFFEEAPDYDILHLAMHGYTDAENPLHSGLIFSHPEEGEQMVYLHELREANLKARLAVLSACETGFGKYEKSDGINSIAQSFTYAGVPSVVMSLWKVPDAQTKQIMVSFYKHLKAGAPKDVALQNAKKDYLTSNVPPELAHPYFWAGFILQGDIQPLTICTWGWHRPFAYSVLLALGLIVFGVMLWRNFQDRRK